MAMNNGMRFCASKLLGSTQSFLPKTGLKEDEGSEWGVSCYSNVNRGIHSTGAKRMGGGHGHDEPYYLHAKHMYNLDRMKHQQLKMTLGVLSAFSIGVAVPVYAVIFQQKKTTSA